MTINLRQRLEKVLSEVPFERCNPHMKRFIDKLRFNPPFDRTAYGVRSTLR